MRIFANDSPFSLSACLCSFSFAGKLYGLYPPTEEGGEYLCQLLRWNAWQGYVISEEDALPEEALRVAELLLSLSFQKPEKYRLKGEHYDVSPIDSDEKQRYHLRAERTLFRSNFKNMLPTALRFFVFAVITALMTFCLLETAVGWLSYLFPRADSTVLRNAVVMAESACTVFCFLLWKEKRDLISLYLYAYLPIGTAILMGILKKWDCLFLVLIPIAIAAVSPLLLKKRLVGAVRALGGTLVCVSVFAFCLSSVLNVYPYTYESAGLAEIGTDSAVLQADFDEACAMLSADVFDALSPEEKLEVLQRICDYECIVGFGCASAKVCAGLIDDPRTHGYYENEVRTITIDVDTLCGGSAKDSLTTLLHEIRHHYQFRMVGLYQSVAPYLQGEYQDMPPFREAKEYLLNFNDYKKSDKDTYDDYYEQLVETDSRAFSEKRLQEFYLAFIEK